ncbi:MAG: fasciclin domain-containing protein [Prevotella sp.]|nr:fasciclin domain-containing protein [Prevotella sp.]
MKRDIIFKKAMVVMATFAMGAMITACSDWDDHYDAGSAVSGSATSTIWQNIESNNNLSQFAALVKKAGYDAVLNTTQTYTVWAPLNGTFDYEALSSLGNDKLVKEFVQNHIARSNFPATGTLNERIFMLNEKVIDFEGAGSYTIGGIEVAQPNVSSLNGVIHTTNGKVDFLSNIFESLEPGEFAIDSISNYFHAYDVLRLSESKSIQGPVVNGQITYLDSVFDDYNYLTENLYATHISREDSNYTMIVPTNTAWNKAMAAIAPYYNYVDSFTFIETPSTTTSQQNPVPVKIDAAQLRDSVTHFMLARGLFYNNNLYDNGKIQQLKDGQSLVVDSLVTTGYDVLFSEDAANLFRGTTHLKKSNGDFFVTGDSLYTHPWLFWNPLIKVEAELSQYQASSQNGTLTSTFISSGRQNPDVPGVVSNRGYVDVQPATNVSNPIVTFYLPNVRSTTYRIYGVFVPANITNTYITEVKPHLVEVGIGYNNADGSVPRRPDVLGSNFSNDPTKVDTVYFGEFTFPIAYFGTGNYYPYLRVTSRLTSGNRDNYDNHLRIDCLLLVPKELDEYVKEHPDYKYQSDAFSSLFF